MQEPRGFAPRYMSKPALQRLAEIDLLCFAVASKV